MRFKLLVAVILFLAIVGQPARPQEATKPLSKDQVMELVKAGMDSAVLAEKVKQAGIDFDLTDDYLQDLRTAGEAVTAQLEIETSPNAEVYLDGQLAGRAGARGLFAAKSKPGVHAVKVSSASKKDFQQNVTLIAGQVNKIAAALADLGPTPGAAKVNPKDGLKYVWIPQGTFQMGCSPGDNECYDWEKPSHRITLTKGFWIGQTPVTVGAYKRFAGGAGKSMPPERNFMGRALNSGWNNDAMPIVDVTWDEAHEYCTWVGGRLPTEAEMEYAARGGSTEARHGPLDDVAWYADNSGQQRLDSAQILIDDSKNYWQRLKDNGNGVHEVAQKRPNGFGLFDTLGNVWEWVNDWYDANYYQNSPSQDPAGPSSGTLRVLRGGAWDGKPRLVRVSGRGRLKPANGNYSIGFRCVGEVDNP